MLASELMLLSVISVLVVYCRWSEQNITVSSCSWRRLWHVSQEDVHLVPMDLYSHVGPVCDPIELS